MTYPQQPGGQGDPGQQPGYQQQPGYPGQQPGYAAPQPGDPNAQQAYGQQPGYAPQPQVYGAAPGGGLNFASMTEKVPFLLFGMAGASVLVMIFSLIGASNASHFGSYYPWMSILFYLALAAACGGAGLFTMQRNPLGKALTPVVCGAGLFFGLTLIAAPLNDAFNSGSPDWTAWINMLFGLVEAALGVFVLLIVLDLKSGTGVQQPAGYPQAQQYAPQGYPQAQQQQYQQPQQYTQPQPQQQQYQQPQQPEQGYQQPGQQNPYQQ